MSENWTREDMVRMLGSEAAADMARMAADATASVEEADAKIRRAHAILNDVRLDDTEARVSARLHLKPVGSK